MTMDANQSNQECFERLRNARIAEPTLSLARDCAVEAIIDGHVTIEIVLEALRTLEEGSGQQGWNEFAITEVEGDPQYAEVYYLGFQDPKVICSKAALIELYHQIKPSSVARGF